MSHHAEPTDATRCLPSYSEIDALPRAFVVGCQKSGTTWMQALLGAHPEACSLGEACFGGMLVGPMAKVISNYNGHQRAGEMNVFSNADALDLMRQAVCVLQRKWVSGEREAGRIRIIAEKTPEHALALPTLSMLFPSLRAVHIVRDGRDGVVSGWHHNRREDPSGFGARFPTMADYARYFAQEHWVPYLTKARAWGRDNPERYFEVRYEDVLGEPQHYSGAMFSFLGLDASGPTVERAVRQASFENMSGGRERGRSDNASHVRRGQAGAWRDELDADAVRAFESVAGGLLRELGYDSARAGAA